jgi:hypothetical protein
MPKYTNKTTGVIVEVPEDAPLPPPESDWESGSGGPKRRRRADTGSVPVQNSNNE